MMQRPYETPAFARPMAPPPVQYVYVPVPMQAPTRSMNNAVRFMAYLLAFGLSSFVITMAIMMVVALATSPS